jgi:signal transduction histidine kinase
MKELMDIIGWETERLNRSVDELREFSRPRHLNFQLTDLREVVKKAIIIMNQDYELIWGRKIVRRFPKELSLAWIDSDAMEQVALNLIKNGLQAVRVGGVVEVRIQSRGQGTKKRVRLVIKDNGPGIKEEDLQRIFEPYFSTRARGIGLGMHIVKQIVESHQGVIHVNSEVGKGTTVFVDIPVERINDG